MSKVKTETYTMDKDSFEELYGKELKQKTLYNKELYPDRRFIVKKESK